MPRIPRLKQVDDVVAEDYWSYTNGGKQRISRISIGRPRPWPNDAQGDWLCPLDIEGFTDGVRTIAGVGPVDSLMNALGIVRAFATEIGSFTPGALKGHGQSRQRPSTASSHRLPKRIGRKKKARQ